MALKWTNSIFNKKSLTRREIIAKFFGHPEHDWIVADGRFSKIFDMLLTSLKTPVLKQLFIDKTTLFILQKERLSTVFTFNKDTRVIFVFEGLIELIKTVHATQAVAILAHELGHLYFQHDVRMPERLKAQLEADYFAIELGFAQDLLDFLTDQPKNHDITMRIGQVQNYLSQAS
ncbi:MAG: hypothetical protein Fur0010_22400 [Bdellovibrio sp.]